MDKDVLEVVLKRCEKNSQIQRIIDMEIDSPLAKGENYTSNIIQIKLKVVLGNGRISKKSLIVKRRNTGFAADKLAKDNNIFQMEASMYSVIFKEMEYLMDEFEDTNEPLWCKYYTHNPVESYIILEDLKTSGFRLVSRQIGLDLDHSQLVLRNLARYHGMAKILEERGLISKDNYKPHFMFTSKFYVKSINYGALVTLTKAMKKKWGSEWAQVAEKLSIPEDTFVEKVQEGSKFDERYFKCLNHGDCWSNNMMFKYDWQNMPKSVRFLDYQVPHYNTPCADLIYFLYISIQPKLRRQNYKQFLECYHSSLIKTLDRYGYTASKPSLAEIEEAMDRLSFFGLTFFVGCYPLITCKATNALDLDKVFESDGKEGYNEEIYNEEGMIEKIGADLRDLVQIHLCK